MRFDVVNNNLVLLFRENISSFFRTDGVEESLSIIYAPLNPTPIISKIPPNVTIFIPQAQVGVLISNQAIMVSDQTIGDFDKKDVVSFTKLVAKVKAETGKSNISYGYNYIYQVSGDTFANLCTLVKKNLLNSLPFKIGNDDISYMLPTFSIEQGGCKISIKINPVIEGSESREVDRIIVEANIHFNLELPDLETLTEEYKAKHKVVFDIIKTIFKAE